MDDVTTTVDTYLAMWNETDPGRRADHIRRAWTEDGRYVDPLLEAEGHAALADMVAGVHEQFRATGSGGRAGSTRTTTRCASAGSSRRPTARSRWPGWTSARSPATAASG